MLVPTIPFEVPLAAETDPRSRTFDPKVLYRLGSLMRFVNLLGLPALSVPVGFDARGVPIGLQIIGRLHEELRLLDLGTRLQKATDWHARMPPSWVATLRH
jgi:aspartyl-tRNA(Asn)/glutamyl-tRNA(Gln) amidotransferase subunit A